MEENTVRTQPTHIKHEKSILKEMLFSLIHFYKTQQQHTKNKTTQKTVTDYIR